MLVVRQNLGDPFLLMTELACYLGLRICEVLGLMWEDFDLTTRTLSIRRSAVDGVVADVKSEASRDVIPQIGLINCLWLNFFFSSTLPLWPRATRRKVVFRASIYALMMATAQMSVSSADQSLESHGLAA